MQTFIDTQTVSAPDLDVRRTIVCLGHLSAADWPLPRTTVHPISLSTSDTGICLPQTLLRGGHLTYVLKELGWTVVRGEQFFEADNCPTYVKIWGGQLSAADKF